MPAIKFEVDNQTHVVDGVLGQFPADAVSGLLLRGVDAPERRVYDLERYHREFPNHEPGAPIDARLLAVTTETGEYVVPDNYVAAQLALNSFLPNREPVESSNVAAIGFVRPFGLFVEFLNGSVYMYQQASYQEYLGLKAAESHGSWFNTNIKKKYVRDYVRVR